MDVCPDGKGRREINGECCQCPKKDEGNDKDDEGKADADEDDKKKQCLQQCMYEDADTKIPSNGNGKDKTGDGKNGLDEPLKGGKRRLAIPIVGDGQKITSMMTKCLNKCDVSAEWLQDKSDEKIDMTGDAWKSAFEACPAWGEYSRTICSEGDCKRDPTDEELKKFCTEYKQPRCRTNELAQKFLGLACESGTKLDGNKDTEDPGNGGTCDKKTVKQGCRLNSQCIETCPGLKLKQRHGSIEFGEADISLVRESKGQMKIQANSIKVNGKLYLNEMENSLDDIVINLRKKVAGMEDTIEELAKHLNINPADLF